jgi:hypothetical protein
VVALGLHVPEWLALRVELVKLSRSCRAFYVGVMSTGNVLWCSNRIDDELADAFYLAEIAPRRFQMRRGIPIDIAVRLGPCTCVARSFASIYVLLVCGNRHDKKFDVVHVRSEMRRELPLIEALTIALPPLNPEPTKGVGKLRA